MYRLFSLLISAATNPPLMHSSFSVKCMNGVKLIICKCLLRWAIWNSIGCEWVESDAHTSSHLHQNSEPLRYDSCLDPQLLRPCGHRRPMRSCTPFLLMSATTRTKPPPT